MRRFPIGEETEPVPTKVKNKTDLLTTTHLEKERNKGEKEVIGAVRHVRIHVRRIGRADEEGTRVHQAGGRRYLITVTTIFAEITDVGNDKGRVH